MKSIGKKLILIAFILSIIATGLVFVYLKSLKTPEKVSKEITILVAKDNIPARTFIDKKMLKEIQAQDSEFLKDYVKDEANIVGKYTKEAILKDEGFHKDKLTGELQNELTFKIEDNHRAISINVTGESAVSDLIKQGDFVDIIVYLPEKRDGQKVITQELTRTILQNIKVLAVDKSMYSDEKPRVEIPKNYLVTLSVPIDSVEKLVLAEDIGKLKLVLRPANSDYIYESSGTASEKLIDNPSEKPQKQVEDKNQNVDNQNEKYVYYKVQKGDTLRKISRAFYDDSEKYVLIKEANSIENENQITTGRNIKIPIIEK